MSKTWSLNDMMDGEGFYCDPRLPYSVKPASGRLEDTSMPGGIPEGFGGTAIDCRFPVEVREAMALGKRPVISYSEWCNSPPE